MWSVLTPTCQACLLLHVFTELSFFKQICICVWRGPQSYLTLECWTFNYKLNWKRHYFTFIPFHLSKTYNVIPNYSFNVYSLLVCFIIQPLPFSCILYSLYCHSSFNYFSHIIFVLRSYHWFGPRPSLIMGPVMPPLKVFSLILTIHEFLTLIHMIFPLAPIFSLVCL